MFDVDITGMIGLTRDKNVKNQQVGMTCTDSDLIHGRAYIFCCHDVTPEGCDCHQNAKRSVLEYKPSSVSVQHFRQTDGKQDSKLNTKYCAQLRPI